MGVKWEALHLSHPTGAQGSSGHWASETIQLAAAPFVGASAEKDKAKVGDRGPSGQQPHFPRLYPVMVRRLGTQKGRYILA